MYYYISKMKYNTKNQKYKMLRLLEYERTVNIERSRMRLLYQGNFFLCFAMIIFLIILIVYFFKIKPGAEFEKNTVNIKCRVLYNNCIYEQDIYFVYIGLEIRTVSVQTINIQYIYKNNDNIYLILKCQDMSCVQKFKEKYNLNSTVDVWSNDGVLYENKPETDIYKYMYVCSILLGVFTLFVMLYLLLLIKYLYNRLR